MSAMHPAPLDINRCPMGSVPHCLIPVLCSHAIVLSKESYKN